MVEEVVCLGVLSVVATRQTMTIAWRRQGQAQAADDRQVRRDRRARTKSRDSTSAILSQT